ncbi:unnamed protein product, partial [Owenia fusiformis]
ALHGTQDEGLQKLNKVCECLEKVIEKTQPSGQQLLNEQSSQLKRDWDQLNKQLNLCSTTLEGMSNKWNSFEQSYGTFVKWLADVENLVAMEMDPKAELVEKQTQLERY